MWALAGRPTLRSTTNDAHTATVTTALHAHRYSASESLHAVQFYETDGYLAESLADYIGDGLRTGEAGIVIATAAHRAALEARMVARGIDVAAATAEGRYVALDAHETLAQLFVEGHLSPTVFVTLLGNTIIRARGEDGGRRVRAFGEMVALLWSEGRQETALELEELWNDLARSISFALICAYPTRAIVTDDTFSEGLVAIKAAHDGGLRLQS